MADERNSPRDAGQRVEGPTPGGGAYAIRYVRDDGSSEIVEFDDQDRAISRTYSEPPRRAESDDPGTPPPNR